MSQPSRPRTASAHANGPRQSHLIVEPSGDIPLVWYEIHVRGGSAIDPVGHEGFAHHAAELARRGAGGRTREALDEALDALGAALDVSCGRDAFTLHGVSLSRNLDAVIELATDVLARPLMDLDDHERLITETLHYLDELRDDDANLAMRFFTRDCVPGHPYSRTALGNEASLARLERDALVAAYRRAVVPRNLIIGFAGDVTEARAEALAARLVAALPDGDGGPAPDVSAIARPRGRRTTLVDKPERLQVQLLVGHDGPAYACPDHAALAVVETAFGGAFTSRLMQEIRVKRGWSYGAGCRFGRHRGPSHFRISLAPSAEVAPDALALVLALFDQLATGGLTDDELQFAKRYLARSWPFSLATARDRLRLRTEAAISELSEQRLARLPDAFAAVTLDETREAIDRWLHPEDAFVTLVATADELLPRLSDAPIGPIDVVEFEAY